MPGPYAVRIRTPDGWQDIALQGPTGATGAAGAAGALWRSGTGAPAGALGIVGDWYLNDANGDVYEKTGASTYTLRDNLTGPQGAASTVPGPAGTVNPYQIGQTWGVGGALTASMILPSIFVPKRSNQSITIVGARAVINSGTSIGIQLQRNGTNVGSVMTVTTTASLATLSQALADGDRLSLVTSSPSGSPSDLSYTVLLEHTAT